MARPFEYVPIRLRQIDEKRGRAEYRKMKGRKRIAPHDMAWAGFAAEHAARNALDKGPSRAKTVDPTSLRYDFGLVRDGNLCPATPHAGPCDGLVRVEMKVRPVDRGWTDPRMFNWLTVPTHDGREPVKPDAQLVLFGWYSYEQPRRLWLLGVLRGLDEFQRVATFYDEGEPLPRGGWAPKGGAYSLEPEKLRRVPPGLFKAEDV